MHAYSIFISQILNDLLNGLIFLNELIGFHLTDTTNGFAIITTTQDAHINKLYFTQTINKYLILGQFHILQNLSQVDFQNTTLILL